MGLETATYISDLVITNPVSTDPKSQGDDHIRLLKSTIKSTFPNVTGAISPTQGDLNSVTGAASTGASINVVTQPVGDASLKAASTAFVAAQAFSAALPGQVGNSGKFLATDGSSASWASAVTPSGTQTLSNKTIVGLLETKTAIAASNIDVSTGNYFTKTISGTTTFTVTNIPATGTTASFILELTNGGSATVNWWSGVKWASGVAPTLTAAGVDILGFYSHDGGTTWRGLLLAKDSK